MTAKARWLLALAAPALVLGIVMAAPGAAAAKGVTNSPFFAGYEAVAKPGGTVTSFKYVQATFTVPALNCTSAASGATQLVRVGGNGDFNGAQIDDSCQNGSPTYTAKGLSTCNGHDDPMFPTLTISPGDTIKLAASGNGVEAAFDLTTGAQASNPLSTDCGGGPEAGVLTATDGSPNVANFTQVGFRQIQVQGSNQSTPHPLASSAWNLAHYVLKGPSGRVDVKPEALLSGTFTSAFANDWLAPN
jgi:Peptidase A4 family